MLAARVSTPWDPGALLKNRRSHDRGILLRSLFESNRYRGAGLDGGYI